jgi:hypothetical protein
MLLVWCHESWLDSMTNRMVRQVACLPRMVEYQSVNATGNDKQFGADQSCNVRCPCGYGESVIKMVPLQVSESFDGEIDKRLGTIDSACELVVTTV